ncbi:MAG: efflux RND transporter periplasmic adaptor subunit [Deltaproteobacteria bacterium]|nr:efflux RND transporter periplasmic adaptor subunit [Deltaproteobacteria bacterium]
MKMGFWLSGIIFILGLAHAHNSIGADIAGRLVAAEGKVEAMPGADVDVGSGIIGRISRVYVNEGQTVKKGSLLAVLENADAKAKLAEAQAELEVQVSRLKEVKAGSRPEEIKRARALLDALEADEVLAGANLKRNAALYKEELITQASLDEFTRAFKAARSRTEASREDLSLALKGPRPETVKVHEDSVKRAKASVEYYKTLLEKTFIRSPIDGKVIHKHLDAGETITPELFLVTIAEVGALRVNAEVDETDVGRINLLDPAEITTDAFPGARFKGRIAEIAEYVGSRKIQPNNPAKNLDVKVIQVKIALLEKAPFKLGMTVDVKIMPNHGQK